MQTMHTLGSQVRQRKPFYLGCFEWHGLRFTTDLFRRLGLRGVGRLNPGQIKMWLLTCIHMLIRLVRICARTCFVDMFIPNKYHYM